MACLVPGSRFSPAGHSLFRCYRGLITCPSISETCTYRAFQLEGGCLLMRSLLLAGTRLVSLSVCSRMWDVCVCADFRGVCTDEWYVWCNVCIHVWVWV